MYMLQVFLTNVEECMNPGFGEDSAANVYTVFANYFDKTSYLKNFEGTDNKEFAARLCESASFQHFCDDKFNNELTNYQMYLKILSRNADFTNEQTIKQEKEDFKEIEREFKDE